MVDVGPSGLTIALSGDPGKLFAFEQAMRPFGLVQLTRTGRIALQRSDQNLDMPGTTAFAPARQPPLHAPPPMDSGARRTSHFVCMFSQFLMASQTHIDQALCT